MVGKVWVITLVGSLMATVTGGAALAEGCGDGVLSNETFDGNLRITDDSCSVIGTKIKGNLIVLNSDHILLLNNKVGGIIRVDANAGFGTANVIANTVFGGRIVVRDLQNANVIENETLDVERGNIRVIDNVKALVQKNIAARNLVCRGNTDLDAFVNFAAGEERCPREGGRPPEE